MNATTAGATVFAFAFIGALLGMRVSKRMPDHHLDSPSRDSIKLAVGLIATMTALVLGLVTASAKSAFDSVNTAAKTSAIEILALDRTLARYGPETAEIRADLKEAVERRVALTWPGKNTQSSQTMPEQQIVTVEHVGDLVLSLEPTDDRQRALKTRALALIEKLLEGRWVVVTGDTSSVPVPFLAILVLWLTVTFTIFGMLAPSNRTVRIVFAACAMSVGSSVFLILEMDGPFDGLLTVSGEPLRKAAAALNQ